MVKQYSGHLYAVYYYKDCSISGLYWGGESTLKNE